MKRFTAFRKSISQHGTHTIYQRNPDDAPQYEGVIFNDGTVALRWLTAAKSTSIFPTLMDMLLVHGHPEYGTEFTWHDGPEPAEWTRMKQVYAATMGTVQPKKAKKKHTAKCPRCLTEIVRSRAFAAIACPSCENEGITIQLKSAA